MRTLQEIFDFCHWDATFRAYYDAPEPLKCDHRQYLYLHGDLGNGHSRCGTFIYWQSRTQLERFLGNDHIDFGFDIDTRTGIIARQVDFGYPAIRVTAHIGGNGVQILFSHPFNGLFDNTHITFYPRSHRPYTEQGIHQEVQSYIAKRLLLPPGCYRDLQLQYKVPKTEFIPWYRNYREEQHQIAEGLHLDMLDKYSRITYQDARRALAASGIFSDFNCDGAERDQLTEDFVQHYNR